MDFNNSQPLKRGTTKKIEDDQTQETFKFRTVIHLNEKEAIPENNLTPAFF